MQNNPTRVRWDHFLPSSYNTKTILPSRSSITKTRPKPLPPVRSSNPATKPNQLPNRQSSIKTSILPPIDDNKKNSQHIPIVLVLSKPFYFQEKRNMSKYSIQVHPVRQNYAQD